MLKRSIQAAFAVVAVTSLCAPTAFLLAQGDDAKQDDPRTITAPDPLEEVIRRMRLAKERIEANKTDKETQEIQQLIVKDLEKLIELAKQKQQQPNQPPPPKSQDKKKSDEKKKQADKSKGKDKRQEQKKKGGSSNQPRPDQPQKSKQDKARESSKREKKIADAKALLMLRRQLVKDVWGHLPEALRQEILNVSDEKFLPKYEDQVRRYFEALVEESRKNRRK